MLKKLLLVFIATAAFHRLTESYSLGYGSSTLRRYIQLAQALKYGNDCTWEAEEYRQNFTKNKLLASGIPNLNSVIEMANTMVERDYKLCSAAELFICDQESLKCVCGDPGFEALLGVNRSLYTLEASNKCRWNTNTYCVSEDQMRSQRQLGITVDSKCKTGTTCKLGTGESCSLHVVMRQLLQKHGFGILFNARRITEEVMSGQVCTCKMDQVEQVEDGDDSTENQIDTGAWNDADAEPSARRKRSISEDLEASVLAKYVAGSAVAI